MFSLFSPEESWRPPEGPALTRTWVGETAGANGEANDAGRCPFLGFQPPLEQQHRPSPPRPFGGAVPKQPQRQTTTRVCEDPQIQEAR